MSFKERLKRLDSHSSVSKEFRVYTVQGAALSVVTCLAIVYLIWKEMNFCFETVMTERVHVNATSPTGLDVEFDISLPQVPCSILNIDANDPSGQTQSLHLDRRHHIWKHRLKRDEKNPNEFHFVGDRRKLEQGSTFLHEEHLEEHLDELGEKLPVIEDDDAHFAQDGSPCGSCYGAGDEGECCDTCDDIKRAYKRKGWHLQDPKSVKQCQEEMKDKVNDEGEGCNVHGLVALDSGGGSFHLAPGKDHSMTDMSDISAIFDLLFSTFEQFNVTHTVHKIRFGSDFPGNPNQLDGESRVISDGYGMHQYYFKIVPTMVKYQNGTTIQTNQYSVTEHLRHVNPGGGRGLPGVFFFYEISPLHVEIVEGYRKGWIAFFTSVCAIVGGVVTTMGLLDQVLYAQNQRGSRVAGQGLSR